MPNFVQLYRSTDTNAPVLSGQVGTLVALLDAVLVNGYGSPLSVTSITEAGTTYTVVLAAANSTLDNNDHLTFAGITGAGTVLNAVQSVTVVNSTTVSFTGPGGLGTITGTITYAKAPLGWTKPFAATNFGAYRPQSISPYPQHYLRISDNGLSAGGALEAIACGAESMSDINTGTGKFPTTALVALSGTDTYGGVCWRKAAAAGATARPWWLWGDGATFYFVANSDASVSAGRNLNGFGGYYSFKAADAYNTLISGSATFNSANTSAANAGLGGACPPTAATALQVGLYTPRSYSQAGGAIRLGQIVPWGALTQQRGVSETTAYQLVYPHSPDSALWLQPTLLHESTAIIRGRPRGYYPHCHGASFNMFEGDKATNVVGLSGVTLLAVTTFATGTGLLFADITGPWNG